jgi:hypothetical protein
MANARSILARPRKASSVGLRLDLKCAIPGRIGNGQPGIRLPLVLLAGRRRRSATGGGCACRAIQLAFIGGQKKSPSVGKENDDRKCDPFRSLIALESFDNAAGRGGDRDGGTVLPK